MGNKGYAGKYKQKVVETMRKEKLSYRETAKLFEVTDHHSIIKWERIYLEEGAEGLYKERRGIASAASGIKKGCRPMQNKQIQEDLISENQRLRAENTY